MLSHFLRASSNKVVPTYTFNALTSVSSSGTSYTFTGASIGTAASNRLVVVCVTVNGGSFSSGSISSVTIGGNTATEACQTPNNNNFTRTGIYYLNVTSGTTANIVVNTSQSAARFTIGVYSLYDLNSFTPTSTDADPAGTGNNTVTTISNTVTESNNGVLVSFATANTSTDITWTNATEDSQTSPSRTYAAASALLSSNSSRTVTASYSGTASTMQLASAVWR